METASSANAAKAPSLSVVRLPRVAITYCTGCKWMLRAAYFGQELLSTFGTKIGEIALQPTVGGIFEVSISYQAPDGTVVEELLWDFKSKRCFPETKQLKQLVRDHIDPDRSLGHSDKPVRGEEAASQASSLPVAERTVTPASVASNVTAVDDTVECKDCA